METKEKRKFPVIHIQVDHSLDKYDDVVLFPKKVEKAKEAFTRLGVPDWSKIKEEK